MLGVMTDVAFMKAVTAPELQVMTYNIRRRIPHLISRSPDRWERRRPLLQRLLEAEHPSIVGVQEALPEQAGFVRHALGEHYRSVGYGRQANRRGEGCPIFYDNDRLKLIDWAQTALSSTPLIAGSTSWGNTTPRVVVRATFRDRITNIEFCALNTHFDQFSRRSRMHSADEILRLVSDSALPALVTGDFNTDTDSMPHDQLTASRALNDCWQHADIRISESWGSFPNYQSPRLGRKRIDWILATPTIVVSKIGVNITRFDGMWPSDHAPVQSVVSIPRVLPLPI